MAFFAMLVPAFVLNMLEQYRLDAIVMVCVAGIIASIQATFIIEWYQSYPLVMTVLASILILSKCVAMMYPKTFLYGFGGLLISSMVFSLGSYDPFDLTDFNVNLWVLLLSSIVIYSLSFWFFPNGNDSAEATPPPQRTAIDKVQQVTMGWSLAMMVFIVFQVFDLADSLAALISVLIVMVPMTLTGSVGMAKIRIIGTLVGCILGLLLQLVLGKWFSHPLLFWLGFTLALGIISRLFSKGPIGAGIGFSALASLTVPMTTTLVPEQQDAVFSIAYRFTSISFSVVLALLLIALVQSLIDRLFANRVCHN